MNVIIGIDPHKATHTAVAESARESWRLLPLRGWSNAKEHPILPGGP
jgi:hypothetical protein